MISGKQIRAARALLDWSQDGTAAVSGVSLRTVQNAESEEGMSPSVLTKMQTAFENHGIEFLPGDGVRFRDAFITVHEGESGITDLWDDIYECVVACEDKEILITNNTEPTSYSKKVSSHLKMHLERLQKIGASEKIIACEGDTNLFSDGITTYRWVQKEDFCDSPTFIYADKVALLKWGPPAKVIVLQEPLIAESMRKLFSHAWKHARTPEAR